MIYLSVVNEKDNKNFTLSYKKESQALIDKKKYEKEGCHAKIWFAGEPLEIEEYRKYDWGYGWGKIDIVESKEDALELISKHDITNNIKISKLRNS